MPPSSKRTLPTLSLPRPPAVAKRKRRSPPPLCSALLIRAAQFCPHRSCCLAPIVLLRPDGWCLAAPAARFPDEHQPRSRLQHRRDEAKLLGSVVAVKTQRWRLSTMRGSGRRRCRRRGDVGIRGLGRAHRTNHRGAAVLPRATTGRCRLWSGGSTRVTLPPNLGKTSASRRPWARAGSRAGAIVWGAAWGNSRRR